MLPCINGVPSRTGQCFITENPGEDGKCDLGHGVAALSESAAAQRRLRQERREPGRFFKRSGIVDSGATWHVTNRLCDLLNVRPCNDRMRVGDNVVLVATHMGEMTVVLKGHDGKLFRAQLTVRYFPGLGGDEPQLLLSTDMLVASKVDPSLWHRELRFTEHVNLDGEPIRVPFAKRPGLPRVDFAVDVEPHLSLGNESPQRPSGVCHLGETHRAGSTAHVANLPTELAAAAIHRRLHMGIDVLRRLPSITTDAPKSIANAHGTQCPHCTEANATHRPHSTARYEKSYAGRLVHMDLVGPLVRTRFGLFQYMLVLVDDHSRFKHVYFLKHKSEAPACVQKFFAEFRALLSKKAGRPIELNTTLHSDNAGEFLSREFKEYLDVDGVAHTMCPPHVHSQNGVAERAIRSIMNLVRANHIASNAPLGFWNYAAQHACDVLNRTTGPPGADKSSYELLTGDTPRIMNLLPFGCRAYAVKPETMVRKTTMDAHAWVGINLGRDPVRPGSYVVWIPHVGKLVTTSEVYFHETLMPWRPAGDQVMGAVLPTPHNDDGSQPPGLEVSACPAPVHDPEPRIRHGAVKPARKSRRVLILFSGPYKRSDGMHVFLQQMGLDVTFIDCSPEGGGAAHDLLQGGLYDSLLQQAAQGDFLAVFAAPPCSTFSVSRLIGKPGPPPIRSRKHPEGREDVPADHRKELEDANELVWRTASIISAAHGAGSEYIIENPPDRGNPLDRRLFMHGDHASLWNMDVIKTLKKQTDGALVTFAQCEFGAQFQKYTTLLYSPGLEARLAPLADVRCTHTSHEKIAGGTQEGYEWTSHESAAYPAMLNAFFAQSIGSLVLLANIINAEQPYAKEAAREAQTPSAPDQPEPEPARDARQMPPRIETSPVAMRSLDDALSPARVSASPATPSSDTAGAPSTGRRLDLTSVPEEEPTPAVRETPTPTYADGRARRDMRSNADKSLAKGLPMVPKADVARRRRGVMNTVGKSLLCLGVAVLSTAPCPAGCHRADLGHCYLANDDGAKEPRNHEEAMAFNRKGWHASESAEIINHLNNGSWEFIEQSDVPFGRKLVKLTWAYKVKRSGKLKSRLCVQGCSQVPGVDYHQTFCATMRHSSLRMLCAISAKLGLDMRRWDFVAAYLQGELEDGETVYCSLPPGAKDHWPNTLHERSPKSLVGKDGKPLVCKIVKPVYGMTQAGRRWQRTLFPWLKGWGLTQHTTDTSVFSRRMSVQTPSGPRDELLIVGVYVDDCFVLSSHQDEHSLYSQFIRDLQARWEVEDEGPVEDLLGVEITREDNCVVLRQSAYIKKMLAQHSGGVLPKRFQENTTPCTEALVDHVATALTPGQPPPDPSLLKKYQSLVGGLLYATMLTRPDAAFAVGYLCRAFSKPTDDLYEDALRVLHYLAKHADLGLRYEASPMHLSGMSDSDWSVQHSTSGWNFMFSQATVSWGSKKQQTIALSSCEAEIVAATAAGKEAVYLNNFLDEFGLASGSAVPMSTDNTGARALSYNPEFHDRTKHIARRHFWIRELVENHQITVPYVNTHDNLADFFTKPLPWRRFVELRNAIMNVPPNRERSH